MLPLTSISQERARSLAGVFFDLDDTFLDRGLLSDEAFHSLFLLRASGLRLIALTGRPASWAQLIARMWPVEAAIAENGALAFVRDGDRLRAFDTAAPEIRSERRARLLQLVKAAKVALPELYRADDVDGRISDFTFDIGEHEKATEELIFAARSFAHKAGAKTTRSSVHLHFTFDRIDKASGALAYLRARGEDTTLALHRFAFIGDSDNDASAFAAFACSVGVRNVRGDFSIPPRYVTPSRASLGFCEFAQHLVSQRSATIPPPNQLKTQENMG